MTDWSTLKKLIWLRIIKGGGSALRTVTGSLIHITDALALPAEALTVNVSPIQDLHGYDSPWPAGGGRNKFNLAEAQNNKWINNTTGEIESVSGFWITGFIPVKSGDVIRSAPKGSARNAWYNADKSQATYFAFNGEGSATAPSDGFVVLAVSSSTVAYGSDFIVTINDADLTFSPYSNICPISGRTSATVIRTGKNLLDDAYANTSVLNYLWIYRNVGFPLKANQTYTFSLNTVVESIRFVSVDESVVYAATGGPNSSLSYTPASDVLVVFRIWKDGGGTLSGMNPMLELGSTASSYDPYAGNTYTIQLGDTVYGGTLDVIDGKMVVDMAMIDMGTLNWGKNTVTQGTLWRHTFDDIASAVSNIKANILCSCYPTVAQTQRTEKTLSANNKNVDIIDSEYSTASDFKTAVTGQQLCYELATPFEITLTPTQIETLLGQNNVWSDAGDLTLTYYADGNASTSEALGILLGGTYNNPGGADDVSDDEALGILLGGS